MINVNDQNYHALVRKLVTDNRTKRMGTNLQNIPARGNGEKVRRCFVPPEGWVFIGADLSSIEPRIMAHILWERYGDNSMRGPYMEDGDPYVDVGMMVFDIPREWSLDKSWYDPVTKTGGTGDTKDQAPETAFQPRKLAKQGLLAVAYGQTAKAFAKTLGVDESVAEHFLKTFNEMYPNFKNRLVKDIVDEMKERGFSQTIFGRKRRFPKYKYYQQMMHLAEDQLRELYIKRKQLLNVENPTEQQQARFQQIQDKIKELRKPFALAAANEREAFNSVIQGSGADILKMNGARMYQICRERGWGMHASIHDELIISVPKKDLTPETIDLVNDVMTKTVKLSVPLKSDTVIMERWMDEVDPADWDFEKQKPKN